MTRPLAILMQFRIHAFFVCEKEKKIKCPPNNSIMICLQKQKWSNEIVMNSCDFVRCGFFFSILKISSTFARIQNARKIGSDHLLRLFCVFLWIFKIRRPLGRHTKKIKIFFLSTEEQINCSASARQLCKQSVFHSPETPST